MKNKVVKVFILVYWCLVSCNSSPSQHEYKLQKGDLLLQNLDCGELCDAIETVTAGVDGKDFSHCAMVIRINDSLKVAEAIGNKVQLNSIASFFERSGDTATRLSSVILP